MSWTYNTPQTSSAIVGELKKINDNLSRIARSLDSIATYQYTKKSYKLNKRDIKAWRRIQAKIKPKEF